MVYKNVGRQQKKQKKEEEGIREARIGEGIGELQEIKQNENEEWEPEEKKERYNNQNNVIIFSSLLVGISN